MKAIRLLTLVAFCVLLSGQSFGKDIARYFNNATTSPTDFMSTFSCTYEDRLCEREVRIWISKNKPFFYQLDSVIIKCEEHWLYGARHRLVKTVYFVTTVNGPKRIAYFEEIKRKKEEERLAILRKQEEARQAEANRLLKIKKEIENGTFSGTHYYDYPEGRYNGQFVKGLRQGHGTQNLRNGEWYEGGFVGGYANGFGTYRQSSGIRYTGNFVNGKRQGKFIAKRWTLGGLIADEWQLEYDNDLLISEIQTQSDLTDFVNDLSESSANSYQDYSSESNSESSIEPEVEDCEQKYLSEFENLDRSKIVYGTWKADNSMVLPDQCQSIEFPDGTSGRVFQGRDSKKYFLSLGGTSEVYYTDYNSTVKALYVYKKCGLAPKSGRR